MSDATKCIDCLCAGIVVADHVCAPIAELPKAGQLVMTDRLALTIGGCAANAAVDLRKLGVRVAVAGRVGDDPFGRYVTEALSGHGIDTSAVQVSPRADTSQTMIVNVAGQDRRFIHCFGANGLFRGSDVPRDRLTQAKVLYLGGYLLMPGLAQEEVIPLFEAAREARVHTVLDVAIPEPGDYLPRLEKLLRVTDLFLPNDAEATMILGQTDPVAQAEAFHKMGAGNVVVTCGDDGAILVGKAGRLRAGVYPIDFVDGSGCGDAFDAGYIFGMLQGFDAADCLRWGSALGASCVRALGTTDGVFTRREAEEFLARSDLGIETI